VRPGTDTAQFVAGFSAAEGSFTGTNRPPTFVFSVGLGAVDRQVCEEFRMFFGVGRIQSSARRKPHYDDEVQFVVKRLTDLVHVIVPFMDEHLPPSYKREQYLEWRVRLLDYWENHARRLRRDGRA
jgi:hypothetical protein